MVAFASGVAVLLYLLPLAVLLLVRSRRDTGLGELGAILAAGLCLDLLLSLLLARLVRLELAVFLARAMWLGLGAVWLARPALRERIAWPVALGRRELAGALLAAFVATAISVSISSRYWIWDREWHVPMDSLMRGETNPFLNVYEPKRVLHYHFAADVMAAAMQSLSFGVIHSSRAMSLLHDVLFGLTAATVALLVQSFGKWRPLSLTLAALAPLFGGPVIAMPGAPWPYQGYSDFSNLTLSFRPHVAVSGLLLVGWVGVLALRLREPERRTGAAIVSMFAFTAVMAITDELSVAMFGLALGAAWLVEARAIHPNRWAGLGVLLGLGATIIVTNRVFQASLVGGGPVSTIKLVAPRNGGFNTAAIPLSTLDGKLWFGFDVAPILLVTLALGLFFLSRPTRERAALFAFTFTLTALACFGFTSVEINARTWEAHRFITAARYALPLLGVLVWKRFGTQGIARAIAFTGMAGGFGSTLAFWVMRAPTEWGKHIHEKEYAIDCRREVGAGVLERAVPTYISESFWNLVAGCRPVFAPGAQNPGEKEESVFKAGYPAFGTAALRELHTDVVAPGAPLAAMCPVTPGADPICERARAKGACKPSGTLAVRCTLTSDDRAALLGLAPVAR